MSTSLKNDDRQLSTFQPMKPYRIHFINRTTPLSTLFFLLDQVKQSTLFTINTAIDGCSGQPALIQVEFVIENAATSSIMFIEMAHLPSVHTFGYLFIKKLFAAILRRSNIIFTWGSIKKELFLFVRYQIFSLRQIHSVTSFNVQNLFQHWFNRRFPHLPNCYRRRCQCAHRPYMNDQQHWSIDMALSTTFREYLDRTFRFNEWAVGLDERLNVSSQSKHQQQSDAFNWRQANRQKIIDYAVNDCLAVTKLAFVVFNNWTRAQLIEMAFH